MNFILSKIKGYIYVFQLDWNFQERKVAYQYGDMDEVARRDKAIMDLKEKIIKIELPRREL